MPGKNAPVSGEMTSALFQLMVLKPFSEITVTDVVRQAGVARVSFYRNFSSTADVLERFLSGLLLELTEQYRTAFKQNDPWEWRECLLSIIDRFCSLRDMLAGCRPDNLYLLLAMLLRQAERLQIPPKKDFPEKYKTPARLGTILNVLVTWADGGMRESREDMADYLLSVLIGF